MKKVITLLIACIILNFVLGFFLYKNWQTRNLLYMHDYNRLSNTTQYLLNSLNNYLDDKDDADMQLASTYCLYALSNSNTFNSYFQDEVGFRLSTQLYYFYDRILFSISKNHFNKLLEARKQLENLLKVFRFEGVKESKWQFRSGWHYSAFPSHPAGKKQAERLLVTIEDINKGFIR